MKHNLQEKPAERQRHLPWRYKLAAGAAVGTGILLHVLFRVPVIAAAETAVILAVIGVPLIACHHLVTVTRRRLAARSARKVHGWASWFEQHRHVSGRTVRRKARHTHPHLPHIRGHATGQLGVIVGRRWFRNVMGTVEQFYLIVAPPRSIKTYWLASVLYRWTGPAIVASTRLDIAQHTIAARMRRGHVLILNPENLAGIPSTVRWSPLSGCEDAQTAIHRAGALADAAPKTDDMKNSGFWEQLGFQLLHTMMHAAALAGEPVTTARQWCINPLNDLPLKILSAPGVPAPDWADWLATFRDLGPETVSIAAAFAANCLAWLADPEMTRIATPGPGEQIDLAAFMHSADTLYLICEDRPKSTAAPYFACFTAAALDTAKTEGAWQPGGRLAAKLLVQLDEAPAICPVDAPRLCSQAGGRGVTLMISTQAPPQLPETWGENGGRTVWDNAVKIIGPGFDDPDMADVITRMAGTNGRHGDPGDPAGRGEPILPANRIRTMRPPHGIMLHRGIRPVRLRLARVYKIKGWRTLDPAETAKIFAAAAAAATRPAAAATPEPDQLLAQVA